MKYLHVIDEAPGGRFPTKHNARHSVANRLVNHRCTDSSWFISVTETGDHTEILVENGQFYLSNL